jgi:hypothetical protein
MYRRSKIFLISIAAGMSSLAVLAALFLDLPLADPEGFLGPAWVRLPAMVMIAIGVDLVPRTLWRARFQWREFGPIARERIAEHWNRERLTLVAMGVVCFYLTYVSYRNLKSFLPLLITSQYDRELQLLDKAIFLGTDPAIVVHAIFGDSLTAHALSSIYLWFLPLVPITLTAWLVWSKQISHGYWFVCAQCLAWTLGTASYYALPTVGPGFEYPWLYAELAHTQTTDLMAALDTSRAAALVPGVEGEVQSVAGFASLHCAITLLLALMAQATLPWRPVRYLLWANFVVTIVATLYFGWHYVSDDIAGIVIALLSFYLGGLASGHRFVHPREPLRDVQRTVRAPSLSRPEES